MSASNSMNEEVYDRVTIAPVRLVREREWRKERE